MCKQRSVSKQANLTATFYPEETSSFSIEDLEVDTTLVIYCDIKRSRPWVGLFCELVTEDNINVRIQWLKKTKQGKYVLDTCADGSPYCSVIEAESIMFSDCLQNESDKNIR